MSQPEGAAKHTLDVTVNYGPADITITDPTQQHPAEIIEEVTAWGWDDGTGDEELNFTASDATPAKPKAVLNSAGDPFDTVPTRYVPTPTFTKVITAATMKGISAFTMKNRFVDRTRKLMIQEYTIPAARAAAAIRKNWAGVTMEV